jgi:hypothetical protein
MTREVFPKCEVHCTTTVLKCPDLVELNVRVPYYTLYLMENIKTLKKRNIQTE